MDVMPLTLSHPVDKTYGYWFKHEYWYSSTIQILEPSKTTRSTKNRPIQYLIPHHFPLLETPERKTTQCLVRTHPSSSTNRKHPIDPLLFQNWTQSRTSQTSDQTLEVCRISVPWRRWRSTGHSERRDFRVLDASRDEDLSFRIELGSGGLCRDGSESVLDSGEDAGSWHDGLMVLTGGSGSEKWHDVWGVVVVEFGTKVRLVMKVLNTMIESRGRGRFSI